MAYATADDVAARLGRDLTADETTQAEAVLDIVAGLIADAVAKDGDAWVADPVPTTLMLLSIEKAISALVNPNNLASFSEQLGSYQHSGTYPRSGDVGIFLSDSEERRVRRAVYGAASASVRIGSVLGS